MIDLSYHKPEPDENEPNVLIQGIVFVIFAGLLAIVTLSAIAGEPIF